MLHVSDSTVATWAVQKMIAAGRRPEEAAINTTVLMSTDAGRAHAHNLHAAEIGADIDPGDYFDPGAVPALAAKLRDRGVPLADSISRAYAAVCSNGNVQRSVQRAEERRLADEKAKASPAPPAPPPRRPMPPPARL